MPSREATTDCVPRPDPFLAITSDDRVTPNMTFKKLLLIAPLLLLPVALGGQGRGVAPSELLKPLADSWPTYSGDYSGNASAR